MDQNRKLVLVKKACFLAFLTKIQDPESFNFTSENGQTSEAWEKVKKTIAWDVANNRYVDRFFSRKTFKMKKEEKKCTSIWVNKLVPLIADNVYVIYCATAGWSFQFLVLYGTQVCE